jgi:hypothetical protein
MAYGIIFLKKIPWNWSVGLVDRLHVAGWVHDIVKQYQPLNP